MRCYLSKTKISYKDQVTSESAHRKIQSAIGKYNEHLTLVKKKNKH